MRTNFTREDVREITAKELLNLQREFASDPDHPWAVRMTRITKDLHELAGELDPDLNRLSELEARVSALIAEDKRNKGMTPFLYMVRSLRPSGTSDI
jgi:hypothetical protein